MLSCQIHKIEERKKPTVPAALAAATAIGTAAVTVSATAKLAITTVTTTVAVCAHKGEGVCVHQEQKLSLNGSVFDWKWVTPPGIHLGSARGE